MQIFNGLATAIITPFNNDGIDKNRLIQQINFQISNNIDAIVILGTTGEPNTLTDSERNLVIAITIDTVAKRIPVIVGTGSNDTNTATDYATTAQNMGADGLLVVTPYYNKCSQEGLLKHFKQISKAVNLPIIAYNVPSRTGINILPKTLSKLSKIPNIVAIKDASSNLLQMQEYVNLTDNSFDIYCGDDALVIPYMSQGAIGLISVLSNIIPYSIKSILDSCQTSDYKHAIKQYNTIYQLGQSIFTDVNPIGIKYAMSVLNLDSGFLRLPLTQITCKKARQIKKELVILGLINE